MIVAFAFALGWVIGFLTGSCFVVLIARIAVKQGKLWIVHSPSRRVPASVEVELLNSLIGTLEADNARLTEAIIGVAEVHEEDMKLRAELLGLHPAPKCICRACLIAREGR